MSVAITHGIKVSIRSRFLESESEPEEEKFCFAYDVTVANEGTTPVQLIARHWIIKDAMNRIEEVRGEGVIGQMPWIDPGESFTYTSWCPLTTEYGSMRGSYTMQRPNGETFEATIAPFALQLPALLN